VQAGSLSTIGQAPSTGDAIGIGSTFAGTVVEASLYEPLALSSLLTRPSTPPTMPPGRRPTAAFLTAPRISSGRRSSPPTLRRHPQAAPGRRLRLRHLAAAGRRGLRRGRCRRRRRHHTADQRCRSRQVLKFCCLCWRRDKENPGQQRLAGGKANKQQA